MRLLIGSLLAAITLTFISGCAGGGVALYQGHRGHYYSTYNNSPDYRVYRYHRWDNNTQPVPRNPYTNDPGTAIRNDLHARDW